MSKIKRLRVFAGPNGSGKSTLFSSIKDRFDVGFFVNSDIIEFEISQRGFINLSDYDLKLTQTDLDKFYLLPSSISLLSKSHAEGHVIEIKISKNVIVDKSRSTHSYEASLITSFIRHHLTQKGSSYSFESVMSHPSKLDEIAQAKKLDYKTKRDHDRHQNNDKLK